MDKAGIAVVIAVLVILLGVTAAMSASQNASPIVSAPAVSIVEPKTQSDPLADISDKVKEKAMDVELEEEVQMEETMDETIELEESISMEDSTNEETMMEETAGPVTHNVDVPLGTSVPGCEETNSCFLPADITINAGDTVEWFNVDTAAHTVTGGSPADGPSGVFDSSLLMADASYAFTFEDTGSYDYFCMVHPWMVGSVTVN
jgi:plastocyanin